MSKVGGKLGFRCGIGAGGEGRKQIFSWPRATGVNSNGDDRQLSFFPIVQVGISEVGGVLRDRRA